MTDDGFYDLDSDPTFDGQFFTLIFSTFTIPWSLGWVLNGVGYSVALFVLYTSHLHLRHPRTWMTI